MEGRKSIYWAWSLMLCAGCFSGGAQKTQAPTTAQNFHTAAAVSTDANAKKDPKVGARLLVATAKFNESEANTLDTDPERQFKVRYMAKERYAQAVKLDPSSIEAQRGLGRIYVDLADYERAQDVFKKAQAKFPNASIFWYEQGQMHNRRKEFGPAAQCLQKALDLEPENRQYLTTLGLTLARGGQTDQSVALLSRSMGVASAHYNVARMLIHLQQTDEGMRHLRLAVQNNPNLDVARQLLADMESGGRPNVRIDFQPGV